MSTTNVVSMATKETMLLKLCEEKKIERNTGGIVQNTRYSDFVVDINYARIFLIQSA